MNNIDKTLIIELYNCNNVPPNNECGRIKHESRYKYHTCNHENNLELVISNHVEKRGFGDYVEIKSVQTSSSKKKLFCNNCE